MYSVSIPLGATINMGGAAITITVMTLAAAHTLGIIVDVPTAILLSVIATIGACGASGVAGGSLLLIPLACSLFGISNDVAMQVVGVGFIIGGITRLHRNSTQFQYRYSLHCYCRLCKTWLSRKLELNIILQSYQRRSFGTVFLYKRSIITRLLYDL